jgi:hypothetical protein
MLLAAQSVGDRAAVAMAQHQLGTRALCVGETSAAAAALQAALDLRTALGDTAGAQVTQHNLSLITAPPVPPQQSDDGKAAATGDHTDIRALPGKVPRAAKALVSGGSTGCPASTHCRLAEPSARSGSPTNLASAG